MVRVKINHPNIATEAGYGCMSIKRSRTGMFTERSKMRHILISLLLGLLPSLLSAGSVEIIDANATASGHGRYHIQVTLRHTDSGWEHYANAWRVLAPDGSILGERRLLHPHVDEQPFTRGLTITIPDEVTEVEIEAQDSRHGTGKQRFRIRLHQ